MLVIRGPQRARLDTVFHHKFEDTLVVHVQTYFPNHARVLGEPRIRQVIDYGLARARLHGFTSERNLCLYLDLMLMLGSNFDVDPQLPWAAEVLTDPTIEHPTLRIDRLTNLAMDYLTRSAGVDDEHFERALVRVRASMPTLLAELDASPGLWTDCATALLRQLWPERCALLGDAGLHELIRGAGESASQYDLHARRDRASYLVCSFLLGSGFDSDPQHPWAVDALRDEGHDGAAKATKLYHDGMAWMERLLARPGEEEPA